MSQYWALTARKPRSGKTSAGSVARAPVLLIPASTTIGTNLRNYTLDLQFTASIRERGVLQPITAIRTDDGVEVRAGQRRALAARQVSLATIAVSVVFESLPSGRWPRVTSSARSQAVGMPCLRAGASFGAVKQLRCAHGDSAYPGSPCSSGGRGAGPVMRGMAFGVGMAVGAMVSVRVTAVDMVEFATALPLGAP